MRTPEEGRALFSMLAEHTSRPPLFSVYTAEELWTGKHLAEQMLSFHLDPSQDLASRNRGFINRSVAWLQDHFGLKKGGSVLDLGCGPGLYANALAESGASVTGVDFSQNSLTYARSEAASQGLDVAYHHGNYLEVELEESFDLVLLIFGDFCALGPAQRESLLGRIKGWLNPGGRFLLDVSSVAQFESLEESSSFEEVGDGGFWSPNPHFVFTRRFKYGSEMAYLDRYLVVEEDCQSEFFNWIQCYDPPGLEAELREAGWGVAETFGNVAGDTFDPNGQFFAVSIEPTE